MTTDDERRIIAKWSLGGRIVSHDVALLYAEIVRLRYAIREHRDQRGDDRCWMDDERLYVALPEGFTPPARDSVVELQLCEKYIACRHNPGTIYVSPQREIERLQALNVGLVNRVAAAAEVLGRVANKMPVCRCELLAAAEPQPIVKGPTTNDPISQRTS